MKYLLLCLLMASASFASLVDPADDGYLGIGEYDSNVRLINHDVLIVDCGNSNLIDAEDYSRLEVYSTSLPLSLNYKRGVYDIHMGYNCTLLFCGGATESIVVAGNAMAELKGGIINNLTMHRRPQDSCSVTIFCQDGYQMDKTGISGLWADGTSFDINFIDENYYTTSPYVNIEIVPEPATMALLSLGGLIIRRERK